MFTWSEYQLTVVTDGVQPTALPSYPMLQPLLTLTLRYDLTPTSDLNAQYESLKDESSPLNYPNYGNSRLLTFTYDMVF